MSLETAKPEAIKELTDLMTEMRSKTEISDSDFAEKFFALFLKWIKQAAIKYETGLQAPNGPVTGIFTGKLE